MRLRQLDPDKRKPGGTTKPSYAELDLSTGRNRSSGYQSPLPRWRGNSSPVPTVYDIASPAGAHYDAPETRHYPACRQTLIPFPITPLFRHNGRMGLRLDVGVTFTARDPRGGYPNVGGS